MDYTKILLRPVVTEKATMLREAAEQIAFLLTLRQIRSKSEKL